MPIDPNEWGDVKILTVVTIVIIFFEVDFSLVVVTLSADFVKYI